MKCLELYNCEDDNDGYLTVDVLSNISTNEKTIIDTIIMDTIQVLEVLDELDSSFLSNSDLFSNTHIVEKTTLETCSIVYFAGYLVK